MIYTLPKHNLLSPKPKREEAKTPSKIHYSKIENPRQDVCSFTDLKISEFCFSIVINGKRLRNFDGLPRLEFLSRLQLDGNPINSFEGAPRLPKLRWLSIKDSPLSKTMHFKLMCSIVFGPSLNTVNDQQISQKIKQQAKALEDEMLPELVAGRLIMSLSPLRMIDARSSEYVSPNNSLMEASTKVGFMSPSALEYTREVTRPDIIPKSLPSVASLCEEIILREKDGKFLNDKFLQSFMGQLADLRGKFNAEFKDKLDNESDDNDINKIIQKSIDNKSNSSQNSTKESAQQSSDKEEEIIVIEEEDEAEEEIEDNDDSNHISKESESDHEEEEEVVIVVEEEEEEEAEDPDEQNK